VRWTLAIAAKVHRASRVVVAAKEGFAAARARVQVR
jgi:hypothetical protein